MGYQEERQRKSQIFEDTLYYCERTRRLSEAVMMTRKETVLYRHPLEECNITGFKRYERPCRVVVSKERTLKAAARLCSEYRDSRIGILNFASAVNPGGGVFRGGNAQEENLCRCSTLYPCLNTEILIQGYYDYNRKRQDDLYTDACIYTPGIICMKEDTEWPVLMPEQNWFSVDVISCAIPNLSGKSDRIDPTEGERIFSSRGVLVDLLTKRFRSILRVAAGNQIDALVLGVSDDDVFYNAPYMIVQSFKKALEAYCCSFDTIVFGVYCLQDSLGDNMVFDDIFRFFA